MDNNIITENDHHDHQMNLSPAVTTYLPVDEYRGLEDISRFLGIPMPVLTRTALREYEVNIKRFIA